MTETFRNAEPFPHAVVEGFWDDGELRDAMEEWPSKKHPGWGRFRNNKRGMSRLRGMPDKIAAVLRKGNSDEHLIRLKELTGIDDLVADSALSGGGLHQTGRGGHLGMHVDFNRKGDLYRRLNVLLYVNEGWRTRWRGDLELRKDPSQKLPDVSVTPGFNVAVIFETSDRSWHGLPSRLKCPSGTWRKSFAWYYYSKNPPERDIFGERHSTIYKGVDG